MYEGKKTMGLIIDHRPIFAFNIVSSIMRTACWWSLLGVMLWYIRPMHIVAVHLHYNLPDWWRGPAQCPSFDTVVDADAMRGFDYALYQGTWYAFAHDEPTQPSFCNCDTYNWRLIRNQTTDDVVGYESNLAVDCGLPIRIHLQGRITEQTPPGMHMEGAPLLGAGMIPQFILWVQKDTNSTTGQETYTRAIVYSCQENYMGMNVFHSTQFFSRDPFLSLEEKMDIISRARHLGLHFNRFEHIKLSDFDLCADQT